jgi:hypothetical protein
MYKFKRKEKPDEVRVKGNEVQPITEVTTVINRRNFLRNVNRLKICHKQLQDATLPKHIKEEFRSEYKRVAAAMKQYKDENGIKNNIINEEI